MLGFRRLAVKSKTGTNYYIPASKGTWPQWCKPENPATFSVPKRWLHTLLNK